jgi:hypothetical protein
MNHCEYLLCAKLRSRSIVTVFLALRTKYTVTQRKSNGEYHYAAAEKCHCG